MRFPFLALAFVLAASAAPTGAQTPAGAAPLTLSQALRLAETHSPAVLAREAQLASAEGSRREAAAFLHNNPELGLEGSRRRAGAPAGSTSEWGLGIAQPFETGGQQVHRRRAAAAALQALRAEIELARRQARAQAAQRFQAVLAAQRRVQFEQRSLALLEDTAQAVAKRRNAGEDTRLDANVARIEAERARNALAAAQEALLDARADLATALQLPPSALPEVAAEVAVPAGAALPYGLDQLLASARALPGQRALAAREDAARARLGLEKARRYPDVTLGLRVGRDGAADGRERTTTLSLSVPLPLFQRNESAIGQALSEARQAEIERASADRDSLALVRQLWSRLESQRERVARLQRTLLAAATDNRELAARSRQAGQIGLLDQLLVNRQALDAERDLNEALAEFHATRIELEYAAGWPQEGNAR